MRRNYAALVTAAASRRRSGCRTSAFGWSARSARQGERSAPLVRHALGSSCHRNDSKSCRWERAVDWTARAFVSDPALSLPWLLVNATDSIRLWASGTPVEGRKEIKLDLKAGLHTLTFGLDLGKRREALRVEAADVKGSLAQVRVVG